MRVLVSPIAAPGGPGCEVVSIVGDLSVSFGLDRYRGADVPIQGKKLNEIVTRIDLEKVVSMADNDRKTRKPGDRRNRNRSDARRPRSIRFSDSEWELVERTAARHGIPAGELVRAGALALAEDRLGEHPPATVSPGHLALIESTWRMAYVLATLDREKMLDARRGDELNDVVAAAHRVMAETMDEGPA